MSYRDSITRRYDLLTNRIGRDTYKQSLEMAVCANDPVHWCNNWAFTYDPRQDVKHLPFDLFPKQAELMQWIQSRERAKKYGLVEKTRDGGITFCCVAFAVNKWLFTDGYAAAFGSRKEDYVDRVGDPKSIFEKARYIIRYLPYWMLPKGFDERKHMTFCKIVNPANGATITGEAGDGIGRGGRASIYFVDEAAFLERAELVDSSLSATTDVRIDVSTPNGVGNAFYRKRHSPNTSVFTFRWQDDPRKTEEWAREKKEEVGSVVWAQEYDIDYAASIEGICIPASWVRAAVILKLDGLNDTTPIIGGFDPADGGNDKSVLIGRKGPVVLEPDAWGELSSGRAAHAAQTRAEELGMSTVNYDAIGIGSSVSDAWENAEVKPKFKTVGVKWGDSPTQARWANGKTSAEQFQNLRIELWWMMRERFEKTYQFVNEGKLFPIDELISIPNNSDLISDLSLPLVNITNTGKLALESKADMRRRGVKSPDYADALAYTFTPSVGWSTDSSMLDWLVQRANS